MNSLLLEDFEDKDFDPYEFDKLNYGDIDNPYPTIHEYRDRGPVHPGAYRTLFTDVPDEDIGDFQHNMIFGYDNVQNVLTNPSVFTNFEIFRHSLGRSFGEKSILVLDAPEHTRYRKIFQKVLTPQALREWDRLIIRPAIDDLISKLSAAEGVDLVETFTRHFPFQVIYRYLGFDVEQAPIFHRLASTQLLSTVGVPQAAEATRKLGEFFHALIAMRREKPFRDPVGQLAALEVDGERLPDDVLVAFLRQLMNAAADTTYRSFTVLLAGLLSHPEQLAAVKADRSLINAAIDEALRWDGPVATTWRYVSQSAVVAGHELPRGSIVDVVVGSANRDPAKFSDPDAFNIFRQARTHHLGFSTGPHVCIGMHLARREMTYALNALLDAFPALRLDPDKPAPRIRGHQLRVADRIDALLA